MVRHNYLVLGKKVLTMLPSVDDREDSCIKSRAMDEKIEPDIFIAPETDILKELAKKGIVSNRITDCILVEEVQFLTASHIEELWAVAKDYNIPVICYGLKVDFKTNLFPSTNRLLALADTIEEIKTICSFCVKKATFNMKFNEKGNPIFYGDSIETGYMYKPVCGNCYMEIRKTYKI